MAEKVKKILVPLDGSKNSLRGLDKAITIARSFHGTIQGIYVKSVPAIYAIHPIGFMSLHDVKKEKKFLESCKVRAAKKGISFHYKLFEGGDPGYDIVKFAHNKKNKIDLIVIGSRGMGSTKEFFLGSVSHYVIHKAKIPVLLVK